MLKNLKQNEDGMVLVTVLMVVMIMMILSVSILSMNTNQVMLNEGEVRRIQAETLAFGALYYAVADQISSTPSNSITLSATLGNNTFNISTSLSNATAPGFAANDLTIAVDYN